MSEALRYLLRKLARQRDTHAEWRALNEPYGQTLTVPAALYAAPAGSPVHEAAGTNTIEAFPPPAGVGGGPEVVS